MVGRIWNRNAFILLIVVFVFPACALLKNAPVMEIPASRIICEKNPELIDGNLQTEAEFQANGSIRKKYFNRYSVEYKTSAKKFQLSHDGTLKTETLIKLDKPTYIAYIEIYAGSEIPKLALDYTAEDKSSGWDSSFTALLDRRHERVKNKQVVRFDIRKELLYLRISADAIEDMKNKKTKDIDNDSKFSHEIVTPLKGVKIREVKFYEPM